MIADPSWGTVSAYGERSEYWNGITVTVYTDNDSCTTNITKSVRIEGPFYTSMPPEPEPAIPEPPLWDLLCGVDKGQHWTPKMKARDNRQSIWACRPRHGLSGR